MTAPWTVTIQAMSNVGLVREGNEDAWSVDGQVQQGDGVTTSWFHRRLPPPVVVWVADGMGGHGHGEVASDLALRTLAGRDVTTADALTAAVCHTNRVIDHHATAQVALAGMGTTLCGMVVTAEGVLVTNVGDSSVFQVDDGLLFEISVPDRSAAGDGALSQCLGGGPLVEIFPHVSQLPLRSSTFLLCTDGLTDLVPAAQIEQILGTDWSTVVARLVGMALAAGGHDNVTVALVRIEPPPAIRPPSTTEAGTGEVGWDG